jgi:hypothetical protein
MTVDEIRTVFVALAMASKSRAEYERFSRVMVDAMYELEMAGSQYRRVIGTQYAVQPNPLRSGNSRK